MNIVMLFRGMKHSADIEKYTNKELRKINKHLNQNFEPVYFDLLFEANKQQTHHKIELRLRGQDLSLTATVEGKHLYREIDHVVKVMIKELKKRKEKALDKRDHPTTPKNSF